ncbi:MAG: lysozyme inhibitor LprI family protein [Pararhodobacter sp.]
MRFDPALITACLDSGQWRDCIGVAANACMEATEGGYSTVGMNGCLDAERAWWDADLNAQYQLVRARDREDDASWEPVPGMAPRPSGAELIREVQRTWIAYRDTTCRYEELRWWGGTGATTAYVGCLMQKTAEQALALRSYLAEG